LAAIVKGNPSSHSCFNLQDSAIVEATVTDKIQMATTAIVVKPVATLRNCYLVLIDSQSAVE